MFFVSDILVDVVWIDCLLVYVSKSLMVDFSLFKCVYACGVCVCVDVYVHMCMIDCK